MKKLNRNILIGITSLILICPFLIPITKAQEWTFDGVDTTNIPDYSVYPSEWYNYDISAVGVPPNFRYLIEIVKGNISDPAMGENGTCVWGNLWTFNITSREKTLSWPNSLLGYWNETVGFDSDSTAFIIPVENNGKVSLPILNNVSDYLESSPAMAPYTFQQQQVYPNIYSIAYWNTSFNNAYLKLNYTDDGILTKYETNIMTLGNLTLYSQPAQLLPVFSFTTENDTLSLNSTDFKIKTTITGADNNNDGVTDPNTDYLFRILNGSTWTDWAAPTSLLDWDLGSVAAGNYTIKMEVKNMYGVTEEQVTIEYIPPKAITDGDGIISSYPIFLVSTFAILGISIIIYRYRKKLRI
ncbi:hypothetical protein ES705_03678 [subsurface metagenome]